MKSNIRKIGGILIIIAGFILSSCVKGDFDTPPVVVPKVDFPSNTTIAELKAMHNMGALDSISTDIVIQGIVTANDESGNFYKTIEIQDNTGAIELKLDQTSLYNVYKVGQRIFVKCKGMFLGDYNQLIQLGGKYNNAIGRLTAPEIPLHLFRDSLPGQAPNPAILTIPTIPADNSMMSMLVKFENVSFDDGEIGQEFAPQSADATDRHFKDENGNSIILRSSKYANFASAKIPSGNGTIVGILSKFGTTWQVIIRDLNDIIGFVPDNTTDIFSETFATGLGAFTAISVTGAQGWVHDASFTCAKMSGYQGTNNENEDWLISPALDLTTITTSANISFDHAINKGDLNNVQTNHTLWISQNYTSGDPSTATWEQVTIPVYPPGNTWTFINSGKAVVPNTYLGKANVRFAFKYLSSNIESATWEIKNLKVRGE